MTPNMPAGAAEASFTIKDALSGAFQALLDGDTAKRDKLCDVASETFRQHGNVDLPLNTPIARTRR